MENIKKESTMQTNEVKKLTFTKKLSLEEGKEVAFQLIDKFDK